MAGECGKIDGRMGNFPAASVFWAAFLPRVAGLVSFGLDGMERGRAGWCGGSGKGGGGWGFDVGIGVAFRTELIIVLLGRTTVGLGSFGLLGMGSGGFAVAEAGEARAELDSLILGDDRRSVC